MNKALALSLIIPAYNEEKHLKACLDSVAAQTRLPDEVIVVDNNSTDGTRAIALSYPFVRVIKEKKQGIVSARNAGFNAAKHNLIGRIDSDTILPVDWVVRVKEYYSRPGQSKWALTGGGYFYNMRAQRFNGWVLSQLAYRVNRFICGHYILWGSNMVITKKMWGDVQSETCHRQDIHEDLDLAIHLHRSGYEIEYIESLRVGAYLRRFWGDRGELHMHMNRWPVTLRVHGYSMWWLGIAGNALLWYILQPIVYILEAISRLFGKKSIQ